MELQWGLHGKQVRVNSTCYVHIQLYIPALDVVNIVMSDVTSIVLPNTLNVVVTVTV